MLTDTAIRQAKAGAKPYKLHDEKGLFVLVHPNGSRYFRMKYQWQGREKTLALGVYDDVPLKKARQKRDDARKLLADGIDPAQQRKAEKRAARMAAEHTFERVGRAFIEARKGRWSATQTKAVTRRLEANVFPEIGSRPVGEIDAPELLDVLRKIEARGAIEEAHRTRALCSQVFRYAIPQGLCRRDPAADLRGVLKARRTDSYAAITDPAEVGRLLRAIDGFEGQPQTKVALQLAPLLFVRPGELRHMEWAEIDWDGAVWAIPGAKMKGSADHLVPLAPQALSILRELHALTGRSRYAFPSIRSLGRPLSPNTLNMALRTIGYPKEQMTAHGFRAMASSLLHEQLGWDSDVIERQLAHGDPDKVRAAYNRAQYWDQRVRMMADWADYLDALRADTGLQATA